MGANVTRLTGICRPAVMQIGHVILAINGKPKGEQMYHGKIKTPACPPISGAVASKSASRAPCADFERARQVAASDETLGLLWLRLFDDANP